MSVELLERAASLELLPGSIPELDDTTRDVLATLILDETIEIPPNNRRNRLRFGDLSNEELIEFYRPIIGVLQLDPEVDNPPRKDQIIRASKLGLVPCDQTFYSRMDFPTLLTGLGFTTKINFDNWSKKQFVSAGQKLAKIVGGRPTKDMIIHASKGGYSRIDEFPTIHNIHLRFGSLNTFHEFIGYPRCRGWVEEDYIDWAHAFYYQNEGAELAARILEDFSAKGRGPSSRPIYKVFGSINEFKDLSKETFEETQKQNLEAKEQRFEEAMEYVSGEEKLLEVFTRDTFDIESTLAAVAKYRLAKRLLPKIKKSEFHRGIMNKPDIFAQWCVRNSEGRLNLATVETYASSMDVFDDLWPMYRFQNVDLKLAA